MNVQCLQQLLVDLARFVDIAGGGKTLSAEIEKAARALAPFGQHTISAFGDFLVKAEEYHRTGVVATKGKGQDKKSAVSDELIKASAQEVLTYCELASNHEVSFVEISDFIRRFDDSKKYPVPALKALAQELSIAGANKMKRADLISAIESKVAGRKRASLHVDTIGM